MKSFASILYSLCFIFLLDPGYGQVTLKVAGIPDDTPLEERIFVTGSFNNWNPGDSAFSIDWRDPSQRTITLFPSQPGTLEFKFTRGSWQSVEGNAHGGFLPNRKYDYNGVPSTIEIVIQSWEDVLPTNPQSTAASNVYLLDDNFYIPQLDRNRRILIYLPYSYFNSDQRYPVMYMHDGQNLFDATTSFAGEWQVDETVNKLIENGFPEMIIVGIYNGGSERINELTPYPHTQYGGGQGDAYLRFIIETLKPYVDQQYRTLRDVQHTAIMGSSLGGLISLYAVSIYPDIFGKAGVFSPSLWWSPRIYHAASQINILPATDIYLLGSEKESETMRAQMEAMYNTLRSTGLSADQLRMRITTDGAHSEWYWARELPEALIWLYQSKPNEISPLFFDPLVFTSNNNNSKLIFQGKKIPEDLKILISGNNGQLIDSTGLITRKRIKLSDLPEGSKYLNFYSGKRFMGCVEVN